MGARTAAPGSGLDVDPYDAICDHLLVVEHRADGSEVVVGTYGCSCNPSPSATRASTPATNMISRL
jgi:hypothetical protein